VRGFGASAAKPNFRVIVADDMGFSDAGCYGGEIETPNVDRLAVEGLRFTQCYSAGRCWPSRTCILTGYYAQQVRMDPRRGLLPSWTRVLPHYLQPLGYRSYHSGKWHLFGAPKAIADGGFDHSYKVDDQDRFFSPQRHLRDDIPLPPVPLDGKYYATVAIADHAVGCLKEHAEKYSDRSFCSTWPSPLPTCRYRLCGRTSRVTADATWKAGTRCAGSGTGASASRVSLIASCRRSIPPRLWELYDLKAERSEMKNMTRKNPRKVEELSGAWQKLETHFLLEADTPEPVAKKKRGSEKRR